MNLPLVTETEAGNPSEKYRMSTRGGEPEEDSAANRAPAVISSPQQGSYFRVWVSY